MYSLLQLAFFCLVLVSCVLAHGRYRTLLPAGSVREGDACTPAWPQTCGGFKVVDETVTAVEGRVG